MTSESLRHFKDRTKLTRNQGLKVAGFGGAPAGDLLSPRHCVHLEGVMRGSRAPALVLTEPLPVSASQLLNGLELAGWRCELCKGNVVSRRAGEVSRGSQLGAATSTALTPCESLLGDLPLQPALTSVPRLAPSIMAVVFMPHNAVL